MCVFWLASMSATPVSGPRKSPPAAHVRPGGRNLVIWIRTTKKRLASISKFAESLVEVRSTFLFMKLKSVGTRYSSLRWISFRRVNPLDMAHAIAALTISLSNSRDDTEPSHQGWEDNSFTLSPKLIPTRYKGKLALCLPTTQGCVIILLTAGLTATYGGILSHLPGEGC